MNDLRLHLVCGLPGAGKTTRAREIIAAVKAVHLCADEWVVGLGMSLVDYGFRFKLQDCMLAHARELLRCGTSIVVEFGSWSRAERETIRQIAAGAGAQVVLHFLDAPLDELVRRVRNRGGPDADALATKVLLQNAKNFERPTRDEIAQFDRYFGPGEAWTATMADQR